MKKYLFIAASLLTLFVASCSNEENFENENNEAVAGKTITLNAEINNGIDTRMTYEDTGSKLNFSWSSNDKIYLYKGAEGNRSDFSKETEGNIFKGTVPDGGSGDYYAVYTSTGYSKSKAVISVKNIANQVGSDTIRNGIPTFMVAKTKYLTSATGLLPTLNFVHKLAVLKLTLTFPSEAKGKVSCVTLSGLHNDAKYNLVDDSYTYEDANIGDITVNNNSKGYTIDSDHKITAYVAVFPEEVAAFQMVIYANAGDNKYMYFLKNANTLTAGKVIPVNVSMNYNYEGYECVDLGLPSGTKWATCNVGAKNPSEYGDYYAWGETETKSEYLWSTYMGGNCEKNDCGTDKDPLKDYANAKQSIAGTDFDVAHVKWGGKWKMPTKDQLEELHNEKNCSWEWIENYNGTNINGLVFTSKKTSKSIILPAADSHSNTPPIYLGEYGFYWCATTMLCHYTAWEADTFVFYDGREQFQGSNRNVGMSVRPVSK